MKLHLIRHGQAESSNTSGRDFDRGLSAKGIEQIKTLGKSLENKFPDLKVWCSGAVRTRETLSIVRQFIPLSDVTYFDELYLANLGLLLEFIWQRSGNEDLIIVGHNFGISELASYFSGERIEMGTGQYVCIEFNQLSWRETSLDTGTIIEIYRP